MFHREISKNHLFSDTAKVSLRRSGIMLNKTKLARNVFDTNENEIRTHFDKTIEPITYLSMIRLSSSILDHFFLLKSNFDLESIFN